MWLNGPQAAPQQPTRARLAGIPDGEAGAQATMSHMSQLVRQSLTDPAQKIRELALRLVGNASYMDQARALQSWVQNNIRYIQDPPDIELVQTPGYTVAQRAGDCDDQATLLAALLLATGHPARFVAIGLNGGPLSHVLVQTLVANNWLGAETIIPKPLGWWPPGVTKQYIMKA